MLTDKILITPNLVQAGAHPVAAQLNRTVHAGINPQLLYKRQWRRFAMRRRLALVLLVGFVPATVVGVVGTYWLRYGPVWGLLVSGVWACALLAAAWWATAFRCPRCSRTYCKPGLRRALMSLTQDQLQRNCSQCNLPKFDRRRSRELRAATPAQDARVQVRTSGSRVPVA